MAWYRYNGSFDSAAMIHFPTRVVSICNMVTATLEVQYVYTKSSAEALVHYDGTKCFTLDFYQVINLHI